MIADIDVSVEEKKRKKSFSFKEVHFEVTCRIASKFGTDILIIKVSNETSETLQQPC